MRANLPLTCALIGVARALLVALLSPVEAAPLSPQLTPQLAPLNSTAREQRCLRWRAWRALEGASGYDPLPELLSDPHAEPQHTLWRARSRPLFPSLEREGETSHLILSDPEPLSLLITPHAQLYFHAEPAPCPPSPHPSSASPLTNNALTLTCSHPMSLWLNGVSTPLTRLDDRRWRAPLQTPISSLTLRLSPFTGAPRCEIKGAPQSVDGSDQHSTHRASSPSPTKEQIKERLEEGVRWQHSTHHITQHTTRGSAPVTLLELSVPLARPIADTHHHAELLKGLWSGACGRVEVTRVGWRLLSAPLSPKSNPQGTDETGMSGLYELKAMCVGLPAHLALLSERWQPSRGVSSWRLTPLDEQGAWRGVGLILSQGEWLLAPPASPSKRALHRLALLEWSAARSWAEVSEPYRVALQHAQRGLSRSALPSAKLQSASNLLSALTPAWLKASGRSPSRPPHALRPEQPVMRVWGSAPLPLELKRALPPSLWALWRSLTPSLTPNAPALIPSPLSFSSLPSDKPPLTPLWLAWSHLKGAWGERCEREALEQPRALLWAPRGTLFGERAGSPLPQPLPYLGLRCGEERVSLDLSPLPSGALSLELTEGARPTRVRSEAELQGPLNVHVTWTRMTKTQAQSKASAWRVVWGALEQSRPLPPWPLMGLEVWAHYAEGSRPDPSSLTYPRVAAPDLLWSIKPRPKVHLLTHPWATPSWWRLPPALTARARQERWAEALAGAGAHAWESGRGAHAERVALSGRFRLSKAEGRAHLPISPPLRRELTYPQGASRVAPPPSTLIEAPFGRYEHQTTATESAQGAPQWRLTSSLTLNLTHVNPEGEGGERWWRFVEQVEQAEERLERTLERALERTFEGGSEGQLLMHTPR